MDVEIKTKLDQMLSICNRINSVSTQKLNGIDLRCLFVADIRNFIGFISTNNAGERFDLFSTIYLNKDILSNINDILPSDDAKSLEFFCDADRSILKNSSVTTTDMYVAFFTLLGKHYLFSKIDRKDIDTKKITQYLQKLAQYISPRQNNLLAVEENVFCAYKDSANCNESEENTGEKMTDTEMADSEETLEELLEKLNSLIGLSGVKHEVASLINIIKINQMREERGMKATNISKHLVFLGNPGTGKTTVARYISKIYKRLGVLGKGNLVEVDRGDLVAGYVGQTALKTKDKINEAMGGILFIDEAYTLAKGVTDFGQEAIDTILKAMEDNRDNFVVIVAGYTEPMKQFLESNPGLKSRFNKSITFEDYSDRELFDIFQSFCSNAGLRLEDSATHILSSYLDRLTKNKPENFANAREMRNLFESMYENQANRLSQISDISDNDLTELISLDFPTYIIKTFRD